MPIGFSGGDVYKDQFDVAKMEYESFIKNQNDTDMNQDPKANELEQDLSTIENDGMIPIGDWFFEKPKAPQVAQPEFVKPFETPLSSSEEKQFQDWKAKNAPNDSGADYDLRGAFKAGVSPAENGHWPDTFKKPNHPTFSNESQYYNSAPEKAGSWKGEQFIPPAQLRLNDAFDRVQQQSRSVMRSLRGSNRKLAERR